MDKLKELLNSNGVLALVVLAAILGLTLILSSWYASDNIAGGLVTALIMIAEAYVYYKWLKKWG